MNTYRIEKTYPELKGLPYDVQRKILESAKYEIFVKEKKTNFLGPRPFLTSIVIAVVIALILYFILKIEQDWVGPFTGAFVGSFCALVSNKEKVALLRPKVRDLAMKERRKKEGSGLDI